MSLDSNTTTDESLLSLEAQIAALRGKPDAALQRLAGRTDPLSIRRRLGILLDLKRFRDVVTELRVVEISERWVDLGACAFAAAGDTAEANRYLDWARAQKNPNLAHRTAAFFVDGMMHWAFRDRPEGTHLVPGAISKSERQALLEIVQGIESLCNYALARGSVETEVESQVLLKYFDVLFLLGDRSKASIVFELLLTRIPIPIRLGQAVLQGFGSASRQFVDRLWEEHPESFRARMFSCLILARLLGDVTTAGERVVSLKEKAQSKEQREELCELIYELLNDEGPEAFLNVEKITIELLGTDSLLLQLFRADQLRASGNPQEALNLLERIRNENDPRWLRTYANAKLEAGERAEALELLKRLGETVPSPEVFRAIVRLSREQGQIEDERLALERTLALEPQNVSARRRLGMSFANAKEYGEAARQFEMLRGIQPDDEEVIVNLAVSYSFSGDVDRALSVLVPGPGKHELPYRILKTRVQLLRTVGRQNEAFDEFAKAKGAHWDEPEYLVPYMELAYSAGKEDQAHEAVMRLQLLQQQGLVDEKLMRHVSLEEMRGWFEQVAKRHDEIRRYILQGKMTWLAAAEMQGEVPIWAWLLKTQSLAWVWDDPLNRATYSIYATNGFRVFQPAGAASTLQPISCPPRGTPVAVDLSALITLYDLGLLGRAAEYFGTLYVPTVYLSKVIDDAQKLVPHQQSQKDAAQQIVSAADGRQMSVLSTGTANEGDLIWVHEYLDQPDSGRIPFRLRDLFNTMHAAGVLSDDQMVQAMRVAHKPPAANEGISSLAIGCRLLIDGMTLVTLHGLGLIPAVSREFAVHITQSDYDEIAGRKKAFEALERARTKYSELWTSLRNNPRVRFASTKESLEVDVEMDREDRGVAFAGIAMAKERNLPFLADDRVSQTVVLNDRKNDETAAFGTDTIITQLLESGDITAREAANLLLRLMEWRYRFIVMPPAALKALADQYRAHPPGADLRQVARYVHDCMRDPGLFGGLEPTAPPASIAVRLYQTWSQNIGELLMDVWNDSDILDSYAEELTEWAISEFLPSPPRALDERMQARASSLTQLTVMTTAIIRGSDGGNFERINKGLRSIATALGMEDSEYLATAVRVTGASDD
jgi:tetratricopeptide (TPR) repeat protein